MNPLCWFRGHDWLFGELSIYGTIFKAWVHTKRGLVPLSVQCSRAGCPSVKRIWKG